MRALTLVIILLTAICAAALWGVAAQGHQVSALRAEQKRLEAPKMATSGPAIETATTPLPTPAVPRELLQLRAEVARLSQQQRELANARPENERLRLQLENRRTNSTAKRAGAAYIRKSEAKWLGYNTPEDTLQSIFWAAQNHNLEKFLEAVVPEVALQFKGRLQQSGNPAEAAEEFFKNEGMPPGFEVIGREQLGDGSMALRVQIVPESGPGPRVVDNSEPIRFKQIAGQWKLSSPP